MNWPAWLPPLLGAGIALWFLFLGFGNLRKARVIEDVPTSKIRSAHQGYIELKGICESDDNGLQQAPLTGTDCLWWDFKIERYEGGKHSHWTTIESDSSEASFRLLDGTGQCTIDPRRAQVLPTHKQRWTGYERHPGRSRDISLLGRLRRQRYRYTERRIHSDQPLYAIGWFQTLHAPSRQEQHAMETTRLLREWKQDYKQVLDRFDSDRDGEISLQEWERARQAAAAEARQKVDCEPVRDDLHVLCKPADGRTFLLSTRDPETLSRHFRLNCLWQLTLGAGLAGFSIWRLASHLH